MPSTRSERLKAQSAERREKQKLELRRRILDTASELFLEQGYSSFSLRQVAERIGYSPTTVYLYFENKDDLLFAVLLEGFEQFYSAMKSAYASESNPLAKIAAMGRAYITFGVAHPAHYRLMFMERGDFLLRENPRDRRSTLDSFEFIVRAVHEAHAAGLLRPGEPMEHVYSLWAGVHGLTALFIAMPTPNPPDIQTQTEMHLEVLQRGIARRPEDN